MAIVSVAGFPERKFPIALQISILDPNDRHPLASTKPTKASPQIGLTANIDGDAGHDMSFLSFPVAHALEFFASSLIRSQRDWLLISHGELRDVSTYEKIRRPPIL